MADNGSFFRDHRAPFKIVDASAVTLASTDKALVPLGDLPAIGSNYWWAGKLISMKAFGKITTAATPGNGTFDLYWGSGADANGTIIGSSAAFALTASQTNLSWMLEVLIRCTAVGGAGVGALKVWGEMKFNNAVVANTLHPILIPASALAAVNVDLTVANVLSPQFKRSGSTAETMTLQDLVIEALN